MRKVILVIGLTLSIFGCKAQDTASHMDPMPFAIERSNMKVTLPDSLGGENVTGFSVLRIQLDKEGSFKDFEITKLIVKDNEGNESINYLDTTPELKSKGEYPSNVFRFYDFFNNYLKQQEITSVPGVKPQEINVLTLMVRF